MSSARMIEINRNPAAGQLRVFSVACFAVACVIAYRTQSPVVLGAGAAVAAVGLVFPRAARPLFVGLSYVTFPIGWVVSIAILAVVYFGVVTPIGLLLRAVGRDPLRRGAAPTHWHPRGPPRPLRSYFNLF